MAPTLRSPDRFINAFKEPKSPRTPAPAAWANVGTILRRTRPMNPNWDPSAGSKPPQTFNNKGYFALFALLGTAMVVASIWFFFWAKNGGFVWRKGDWEDYKSTVLRRKGPDGRTLTNATPSTDLGHSSIAGTFDDPRPQMTQVKHASIFESHQTQQNQVKHAHSKDDSSRNHHRHHHRSHKKKEYRDEEIDADVQAYRHEKAARVGGLNRDHDGSHFGLSSTEGSEIISNNSRTHLRPKPDISKKKGFMERKFEKRSDKKVEKAQRKKVTDKKDKYRRRSAEHAPKRPAERRASLSAATASTIADNSDSNKGNNYYASYRPSVQDSVNRHESPRVYASPRHSQMNMQERTGRQSPKKPTIHNRTTPGSFDAYSDAASSDLGTKSYSHHIPELSRGSKDTGFRRGTTGRRRDSLSDSD